MERLAGKRGVPVGCVDRRLALDATDGPDALALERALDGGDLVVAENICSLPLNLAASRATAEAIGGRPAVLHHHDLPWQRTHLAHLTGIPSDDASWAHVTTSELSRRQLAERGIVAVTIRNAFDTAAPRGDRARARRRLGIGEQQRLLLQPTRALPRKNVPGGMFEPKAGSCPWMKSQTGCPLLQSIPSPTLSGTVPWISIAWPYAAG